jgi:hypothetical protein
MLLAELSPVMMKTDQNRMEETMRNVIATEKQEE